MPPLVLAQTSLPPTSPKRPLQASQQAKATAKAELLPPTSPKRPLQASQQAKATAKAEPSQPAKAEPSQPAKRMCIEKKPEPDLSAHFVLSQGRYLNLRRYMSCQSEPWNTPPAPAVYTTPAGVDARTHFDDTKRRMNGEIPAILSAMYSFMPAVICRKSVNSMPLLSRVELSAEQHSVLEDFFKFVCCTGWNGIKTLYPWPFAGPSFTYFIFI